MWRSPHARQTVLARLLEVDRQGIQRFSADDRKMLLTEYARSIARDGVACNAQTCGNTVLQQHITRELRRNGAGAQAAKVESVFTHIEWRTLRNYALSLTKKWPVAWNLKSVPWWVWPGCVGGYIAAAGLLLRRRRPMLDTITLL